MQQEIYNYKKINDTLNYGVGPGEKLNKMRLLKTEIDHLKFNGYWNHYINNLIVKCMIYVSLIIIAINILITINITIKWINSIVIVVPFIDSYYSDEKVLDLIKIVFSKKYRSSAKSKLYKKWKQAKMFSLVIPAKLT